MGGIGSGTRTTKKRTVEGCRALDIARLRRRGKLKPGGGRIPGTIEWSDGSRTIQTIVYDVDIPADSAAGTLRLLHRGEIGEDVSLYSVRLTATGCHWGGNRWWFICPLFIDGVPCGRRVGKLYLCGAKFGCRHCRGLTYQCRQQSDKRVSAALRAGTDLSEFEVRPDMTIAQAAFAVKVYQAHEDRRERTLRGAIRSMRPNIRAAFLKLTGRSPED